MNKLLINSLKVIARMLYRVEIIGTENFDKDERLIVAPNHIHEFDPVLVGTYYPGDLKIMAKKELFEKRFLSSFFTALGAFPVDRKANDIKAIKESISVLKEHSLLMFPEGTRNKTAVPLEAKPGVPLIANKAGVRILPVTVDSKYKLFGKVRIIFHKPVSVLDYGYERLSSNEYKEIMEDILRTIYGDIRLHGENT